MTKRQCCDVDQVTPFCAYCGKPFEVDDATELLMYLREHAGKYRRSFNRWRRKYENCKNDGDDRRFFLRRANGEAEHAERWERRVAAVERLMKLDCGEGLTGSAGAVE